MRTHYDVLGVPPSATADELRRAYHRRAREHHPDMRVGGSGDPMVEVNAAWAVLGDPARRRAYDHECSLDGGGAGATSPAAGLDDLDDLTDLFDPDPEPPPPRPADALVLVPVTLLAMAAACFGFSTITEAPVLLITSVILLAMAGTAFLATPLLVLRRSVRQRNPGRR